MGGGGKALTAAQQAPRKCPPAKKSPARPRRLRAQVVLPRVLLLGSASETLLGRPVLPGATVTAAVEEQVLNAKVLSFKKRRRKHSRRMRGHRQMLTRLRIVDIEGIEE